MTKQKRYLALVVAASAALIAVPVAATPPSGVVGPVIARGVAVDKVKTRGNEPYDVVVQDLTIAAGGHTGWHTHTGMAIAVVTAGTLTIYHAGDRDCTPHEYGAGDVYIDPGYGHVHIGRNEGTTPLEITVTYLDVPIGGAFRIDAANPGNCPF